MTKRSIMLVAAVAVLALAAAACGNGGDAGEATGGGTTVNVELKDFAITPTVTSASAGTVSFAASNTGPSEHEFVVLRTDLAPDALPVEGGKVAEEVAGIEVVGEIEEFAAGGTEIASFDLTPGNYVFICNIPGHYQAGMEVAFQVT